MNTTKLDRVASLLKEIESATDAIEQTAQVLETFAEQELGQDGEMMKSFKEIMDLSSLDTDTAEPARPARRAPDLRLVQ